MIGFAGQFGCWTDNETSRNPTGGAPNRRSPWVWMGHREYDPRACRFLTRDPIDYDGGINLYAYAGGNPITGFDPSGLDVIFGDANHPFLVFTWGGTQRGLQTGGAAIVKAFTWGHVHFKQFDNDPGFKESEIAASISREAVLMIAQEGALQAISKSTLFTKASNYIGSKVSPLVSKIAGFLATKCFIAGTNVQMGDGSTLRIEQIHIGDQVMTRNANNGKNEVRKVTKLLIHLVHEVYHL